MPIQVKELPADLAELDRVLIDPELMMVLLERWRGEVIEIRRAVLTDGRPTIAMNTYVRLMVAQDRCEHAGIAQITPHRLQHTLASEMLAHGASLRDISQVLRHRHLATTAIYAKVDLERLRQVALPWPGAERCARSSHVDDYLRLRRTLGYDLVESGRLLHRFAAELDAADVAHITTQIAVQWALAPQVNAPSSVPATRYRAMRGLARYMAGVKPETKIPPTGLTRRPRSRRPPFSYTDEELLALLEQARASIPAAVASRDDADADRAARGERPADR